MDRKFSEQELIRREKLEAFKVSGHKLSEGYKPSSFSLEIKNKYNERTKEELNENNTENYSIAGRIMMLRNQGKAVFVSIKDSQGSIQGYLRQDELSKKDWEIISFLDLGDIIGLNGRIMKTNTGEVTIRATELSMIVKALRPLPEKFHGLTDVEEIYRRRYLDLIMNDESKDRFTKRSILISTMRQILSEEGYLEVETPILNATLGGAAAEPFVTHHNALDMEFKLRIAPELFLKRLLVGGYNKVFEIGRLFRNEGISIKHNPEFTAMELYMAFGDIEDMKMITEKLISELSIKIAGTTEIVYQGKNLSMKTPFKSIEMIEIVKRETNIDFSEIESFEEAKKLADENNVEVKGHEDTVGHILNLFFEEKCEEKIIQPTFITGYPVEVSPLAKPRKDNPTLTDRFELFIDGREYANAYSELNDSDSQYKNFKKQIEAKDKGNSEATEMDLDFVEALDHGMPPAGGLGIGVDRLTMLLTDARSIRDIILFPHQKNRS